MNKEKILADFNQLSTAKKQNATLSKLVLIFALIVIVLVLIWGLSVSQSALNKVIVVERSGEYLKISSEKSEKLFESLVKTTCSYIANYANSFDRLSITENQAKAMLLCNKDDIQSIFSLYKQEKYYHDALERGVVFRCELEQVTNIGVTKPYEVAFSSILTIIDGNNTHKFRVFSEGELIDVTPQFPENPTGFFFTSYKQTIQQYE